MEEEAFCEKCAEQFDKNGGMLKLTDMCRDCREKVLASMFDEDEEPTILQ